MRPEFPATLGADLVVVAAPDENEIRAGKVSSEFRFWCVREGYSEPIFEGNGRLDSESSGGREGVMPMALDLRNIRIDGPGTYTIYFEFDSQVLEAFTFYVDHASE